MGRTWLHQESLLLHRLDTYPQGDIHYVKWSCNLVLSAKTDLTGAPLSWTWHISLSSVNTTAGPTGTLEHSPMAFEGTFAVCTKKRGIFAAHSWWQWETKSSLGPSRVYEIPAKFIIQRNYSPGDSWVLKHTDFLPSKMNPILDGPGEAICTGKEQRRIKVWLTAGIHARVVNIKTIRNALDVLWALKKLSWTTPKLSEPLQCNRESMTAEGGALPLLYIFV